MMEGVKLLPNKQSSRRAKITKIFDNILYYGC